jgi:hypothetical protein
MLIVLTQEIRAGLLSFLRLHLAKRNPEGEGLALRNAPLIRMDAAVHVAPDFGAGAVQRL